MNQVGVQTDPVVQITVKDAEVQVDAAPEVQFVEQQPADDHPRVMVLDSDDLNMDSQQDSESVSNSIEESGPKINFEEGREDSSSPRPLNLVWLRDDQRRQMQSLGAREDSRCLKLSLVAQVQ